MAALKALAPPHISAVSSIQYTVVQKSSCHMGTHRVGIVLTRWRRELSQWVSK